MNIFELYLDKIKSIIVDLNKNNQLEIPESFNGINAEIPPPKFDCDISTNVAMVLSKLNKTSPIELAEVLSEKWPYVIVACFTVGMLITPPDIISQTLLAVPAWLLFEVGLIAAKVLLSKKGNY